MVLGYPYTTTTCLAYYREHAYCVVCQNVMSQNCTLNFLQHLTKQRLLITIAVAERIAAAMATVAECGKRRFDDVGTIEFLKLNILRENFQKNKTKKIEQKRKRNFN